jgi:hypothetical protein
MRIVCRSGRPCPTTPLRRGSPVVLPQVTATYPTARLITARHRATRTQRRLGQNDARRVSGRLSPRPAPPARTRGVRDGPKLFPLPCLIIVDLLHTEQPAGNAPVTAASTTGFMIVTPRFRRVKSPRRKELDTDIDADKAVRHPLLRCGGYPRPRAPAPARPSPRKIALIRSIFTLCA